MNEILYPWLTLQFELLEVYETSYNMQRFQRFLCSRFYRFYGLMIDIFILRLA